MLKFVFYTVIAAAITLFCILNQQHVALDFHILKVKAPLHVICIAFFTLGVVFKHLSDACIWFFKFFYSKKSN